MPLISSDTPWKLLKTLKKCFWGASKEISCMKWVKKMLWMISKYRNSSKVTFLKKAFQKSCKSSLENVQNTPIRESFSKTVKRFVEHLIPTKDIWHKNLIVNILSQRLKTGPHLTINTWIEGNQCKCYIIFWRKHYSH